MQRLFTSTVVAMSLSTCFGVVAGAQIASLETAQTIVRVKAEAVAPRLLSLQAPGKALWSNNAVEGLIATVEMDGHAVPLHWKLVKGAGQRDAKHVSFVYQTQSPRIRLTWEWSAPAGTGPLEHRIRIENLDTRELWLPLQSSFGYNWAVPATQVFKQIYVDKGAGKPSPIGTHELDVSSGYQWKGTSSTYARNEEPREIIPWFMVERDSEQGDGW